MELRHLRYYVAVAEELSFTHAAETLYTSQPSLSEQIRNLERDVGCRLLRRNRRKVELTEAGAVFLEQARRILRQVDDALDATRKAAENAAASLRIGFVPEAEVRIFPKVLTELRVMFPELNTVLRSMTSDEQEQALAHGEIDIGFLRPPLRVPSLQSELVLREPLRVFLSAQHELAALEKIPVRKLDGLPQVDTDNKFGRPLRDVVDAYLQRHRVRTGKGPTSSNILMSVNMVAGGFGYALLPSYAEAFCPRTVVVRPLKGSSPQVDLLMATARDAEPSPPLLKLMELVRVLKRVERKHAGT